MANKKIYADLTAASSVVATDVIPVVTDTAGTPTTKKSTLQKLIDLFLGGSTPTLVHSAELLANAATEVNTVSTIVKRDSAGMFNISQIRPASNDTVPVIKGSGDAGAGLWFYTSANLRLQRSAGGTNLELGGAGVSFYKQISQYDQNISGNMIGTGWHRNGSITQVGNGAGATTDIFSYTLPAGTYSANKQAYRFEAFGTFAATAATDKRVKALFGGVTIFDSGNLAITTAQSWFIEGILMRRDTTHALCMVQFRTSDAALVSTVTFTNANVTLTSDVAFKMQIGGTNASDVVAEAFRLFYDWESWN